MNGRSAQILAADCRQFFNCQIEFNCLFKVSENDFKTTTRKSQKN